MKEPRERRVHAAFSIGTSGTKAAPFWNVPTLSTCCGFTVLFAQWNLLIMNSWSPQLTLRHSTDPSTTKVASKIAREGRGIWRGQRRGDEIKENQLWGGRWQGTGLPPALNLPASPPQASSPIMGGTLGSETLPEPPRRQVTSLRISNCRWGMLQPQQQPLALCLNYFNSTGGSWV